MWIRILRNWNGKEVVFGISDDKINLRNRSGDTVYSEEEYYDLEMTDEEYNALELFCYDTWHNETQTITPDSYLREPEPEEKSELDLLKEEIDSLKSRITELEK